MLTLFFDYTSPASTLATVRVQRLADEGLAVEFEGFEAYGVDVALPVTLDVLSEIEQLRAPAAREGIELRRPAALPPTARAHAVGRLAAARGLGASWRSTAFTAFWTRGVDLDDADVLCELAVDAGLERDEVTRTLADPESVRLVRRAALAHRRSGVGGVPAILAARTLVPGLLDESELRTLAALG